MTQNERVLRYIVDNGSIDQGVTLRWSPPITRLAARIADLRAAGNAIEQVGKAGKFARYGLVRPTRDGVEPPRRPRYACPVCGGELSPVESTLSPDLVRGRCLHHGWKVVPR